MQKTKTDPITQNNNNNNNVKDKTLRPTAPAEDKT